MLFDEGYHQRSYGWGKRGDEEHRNTKQFLVKLGREGSLQLQVRSATDVVGQVTPERHGQFVRKHRPHGLVVMTDVSLPLTGSDGAMTWLKGFLDQLGHELQQDSRLRRSMKSLVVVLNKVDKSDPKRIKERQDTFKSVIKSKLAGAWGQRARQVPVLPCILIDNPKGGKYADAIIAKLAHQISEVV
jgi:hypothetical protein